MHLRLVLGNLDEMAAATSNQEEGYKGSLPGSRVRVKGRSWKGERETTGKGAMDSPSSHSWSFASAGTRVSSAAASKCKPSRSVGILTTW